MIVSEFPNGRHARSARLRRPDAGVVFLDHQDVAGLEMTRQFIEPDAIEHELARSKIEAEQPVARVFHGDQMRVGKLPTRPKAGFRVMAAQVEHQYWVRSPPLQDPRPIFRRVLGQGQGSLVGDVARR